jgi:hypothetical protein
MAAQADRPGHADTLERVKFFSRECDVSAPKRNKPDAGDGEADGAGLRCSRVAEYVFPESSSLSHEARHDGPGIHVDLPLAWIGSVSTSCLNHGVFSRAAVTGLTCFCCANEKKG